jgi:hypothetical protein
MYNAINEFFAPSTAQGNDLVEVRRLSQYGLVEMIWIDTCLVKKDGIKCCLLDAVGGSISLTGIGGLAHIGKQPFGMNIPLVLRGRLNPTIFALDNPGVTEDSFSVLPTRIMTIVLESDDCTNFPKTPEGLPSPFCEQTTLPMKCIFGTCHSGRYCLQSDGTVYTGPTSTLVQGNCFSASFFCKMMNGGCGCPERTLCTEVDDVPIEECLDQEGNVPSTCFMCSALPVSTILPPSEVGAVQTTTSTVATQQPTSSMPQPIVQHTTTRPAPETNIPKHAQTLLKFVLGCSGGLMFGISIGVLYLWLNPWYQRIKHRLSCCNGNQIYHQLPLEPEDIDHIEMNRDTASDSDGSDWDSDRGDVRENAFLL